MTRIVESPITAQEDDDDEVTEAKARQRLKTDLDHLATALLHRGGWGNGWDEPPVKILLSIVRYCAEQGIELGDDAGEQVAEILARAGRPKSEQEYAEGRVNTVLEIGYAVLTRDDGDEQMRWQRGIPFHPACAPASDPRWKKRTQRWTFQDETSAYLCTTKKEWKERFGEVGAWPDLPATKWCHRKDGPALIVEYAEGGVYEEFWYEFGVAHRKGGPQYVMYDRKGAVAEERWMENGVELRRVVHRPMQELIAETPQRG